MVVVAMVILLVGCGNKDDDGATPYPMGNTISGSSVGGANDAANVTGTGTTGQPAAVTGVGGGATTSTTGQIQCQPGFQLCGGVCVDLLTSTENCGGCGAACPEGRVCAAGSCSRECAAPYTECGDVCVLLSSDSSNCGACGSLCDLGSPCVGGVCGCPDGTLFCQGQCVDPLSDAAHCGGCDTPCAAGGVCSNGACSCPAGRTLCGDACVSLSTAEHCGTCENVCAAGMICSAGTCIPETQGCPAPSTRCGSGCVDVQSDPGNCGGCDVGCSVTGICQGGNCGCSAGLTQCGDSCINTTQNPLHCGACNQPCTVGQTCSAGSCACTDTAATLCGNQCARLDSDVDHCGMCNNACPEGVPCTNGECRCPDGEVACAGACVNTDSDPLHCGTCETACPEGETCVVGKCSGAVGDACTSQLAAGISVSQIAVYQSGKVSVMEEGTGIGADGRDVDLIVGKNAVFRVFVHLEQGWTNHVISARLTLIDGDNVEQLFHKRSVEGDTQENSLATSFNIEVDGDLIKPDTRYAVELVECDATTGTLFSPRFPETGEEALEARDTGIVRIEFIPLVVNGIEAATDTGRLDAMRDFMEAMYPVSAVEYTVGAPLQANSSVSANGNGWDQTLQQLQGRHQSDDAPNDLYYYGLMQPAASLNQYCQGGCVAGIGYVPEANSFYAHTRVATGISYDNDASWTTMAHEVGHNHGREHAPCGGAAQAGYFPYQGAIIGWWGFYYPDTLIAGDQATDIMGYCQNQWISDFTYKAIMDRVAVINGATSWINPNPKGTWEVIVSSAFGASWGVAPQGEVTAVGAAEPASVLDAAGNEIAQVTVYRSKMDHLSGASIMVPTAQAGWHAIAVKGLLPMVYGSKNSSVQ